MIICKAGESKPEKKSERGDKDKEQGREGVIN